MVQKFKNETMSMKRIAGVCLIGLMVFSCKAQNQMAQKGITDPQGTGLFPRGDKITNDNFVGNAWLYQAVRADSVNQTAVGSVTFEKGARTKWHFHPAGQILIAIGGVGYYQEKGSPKRSLRKGDVVKCPPNVPHWHGASRDRPFIQIAITGAQNGPTVWQQAVSDEEYNN